MAAFDARSHAIIRRGYERSRHARASERVPRDVPIVSASDDVEDDVRGSVGRHRWAIPEGYLPEGGLAGDRTLESHETACILNAGPYEAHIELTVFFADREPAGPYRLTVPPRRTLHLRFDELTEPERLPRGTDFASVLESDVPIVVQHTRLDSRRAEIALLSTIAWGDDPS